MHFQAYSKINLLKNTVIIIKLNKTLLPNKIKINYVDFTVHCAEKKGYFFKEIEREYRLASPVRHNV